MLTKLKYDKGAGASVCRRESLCLLKSYIKSLRVTNRLWCRCALMCNLITSASFDILGIPRDPKVDLAVENICCRSLYVHELVDALGRFSEKRFSRGNGFC